MHELLAPEARVLLLAISERPDTAAIRLSVDAAGFDWSRLMWLADREKAVPALRRALDSLPDGVVPPERLVQLSRISQITEFRMLRLEQLLAEALDTLAHEHIDVVLLKGAGLASTVYDSFAARPMYDVDLLVRPEQAQQAWDALRASGWHHDARECPPEFYESHYHLPPLDDPMGTGLVLELHTAPADGAIELTSELIRAHAQPVELRGRRTFVPAPHHQVLHLTTHFAWAHGLGAAGWRTLNDLQRLMSAAVIDWDLVLRDAEATRALTCCYWTFRLARRLAGLAVPDEALGRCRPPRPAWLLNLLERHYAAGLFAVNPAACPSMRMTRMLWSAGMAPDWSNHGTRRPWDRGEVWAAPRPKNSGRTLAQRLRHHGARKAVWARYAAAVLSIRGPLPTLDRQQRLRYD